MKITKTLFLSTLILFSCSKDRGEARVEKSYDLQIDIVPDYQSGNVTLITSSPENINNEIRLTYILPDKFNSTNPETADKIVWFPLQVGSHKDTLFGYQYLFSKSKSSFSNSTSLRWAKTKSLIEINSTILSFSVTGICLNRPSFIRSITLFNVSNLPQQLTGDVITV